MEPLLDVEQLRASDAWAIEERGMPGIDLMERAAEGLRGVVEDVAPEGRVVVVCGGGNNGGDGYAVARLLRERGREVHVLWTSAPETLKGDAGTNARRLGGEGVERFAPQALDGAAVVVDAILGTGFRGAPREDAAHAIEAIDDAGVPVVACDVPSGVEASTGAVRGPAIRAVATATFHAALPGLWIAPGKQRAGEVTVVDIGIPSEDPGYPVEPRMWLIDHDSLRTYPRRGAESTKFASGHVLVAGGSRGLTGAPCLASTAAMRAGAGYVTVCVPAALNDIFEIKLTEVMSVPLPDDGAGGHTKAGVDGVLEKAERGGALVLGPGLGRTDDAFAFARRLARKATVALVLDADGLNAHAGKRLAELAARDAPTILTPHAGELARLLDTDSAAVERHRLEHARRAAATSGAIVVLKGDDTIVAEPDGRVGVSRGGSPALATAGTGDVLSGVLGAFLARGMEPFDAACAAVFAHAEAGRRAAAALRGPDGVIAGDVARELASTLE
ncbi:MAG TPA: NAD(P)H-hydrate dehydratase [Baekduia sp.]|uniref:NAD(P)H-hydrate dehydratase n=1 Tax=Baekduia sp. TaxID=2600305 RepID=UPI002D787EC6|nr:NAD(P)H-hydrate dehydratase [Baekduia sp.]HET6507712.1 NAD(P)H-hydrate dehydratase [Baekduia sp.]